MIPGNHHRKLALGTVQFGLDYGISNRSGRTPADEVARILTLAADSGIDMLDTARAYGEAEQVLGQLPGRLATRFRIVSKTRPGAAGADIRLSVQESLAALGIPTLDALLFHRASDLAGDAGARNWAMAESLRREGLVSRIGVSAYTGDELRDIVARFPLAVVQVPVNLFDQRLLHDGTLADLKSRGVEIHVRSAFLQGLLLMSPADVPAPLAAIRARLQALDTRCRDAGMSRLQACLGFLLARPEIDRVVLGVNSVAHLREILAATATPGGIAVDDLAVDDPDIIDPSRWRLVS